MKKIELAAYHVIQAGVDCKINQPISVNTLASIMERNENYIFWLEPLNGNVTDQIPAVSLNGTLFHINLRLEKAIFRRVRLCKNFCNVEHLQDGTKKLRIPNRLLREKQRTSLRHLVSPKYFA